MSKEGGSACGEGLGVRRSWETRGQRRYDEIPRSASTVASVSLLEFRFCDESPERDASEDESCC